MPEITHKDQPSITATPKPITVPAPTESRVPPAVNAADLQRAVEVALKNLHAKRVEAAQSVEPNWATMTEADASNLAVYIPTVDHEIPEYMNIKLKDPEYMVVWASKDQRRVGQLQAEGYELLKKEHMHPDFKVPLLFDSEGLYRYEDVIAMRVHKRILLGKRRRMLELSQKQLSNNRRPPSSRIKDTLDLFDIPTQPEAGTFYEPVI